MAAAHGSINEMNPNYADGGESKTIEEMISNATHPLLKQPDWGANLQIVDSINQFRQNHEFLVRVHKALRPRVTNSDPKIGLLGLALLESIVKNCPSFHGLVANRDFLKEIIKTVPKKVRDPQSKSLFRLDSHSDVESLERTDRVLIVIQSWAKAFGGSKSYPAFAEVYQDLVGRGVKFPEPSIDEVAPVWTPPVHIPSDKPNDKPKPKPNHNHNSNSNSNASPAAAAAAVAKANRGLNDPDCRACLSSVEVLDSMLTMSDPKLDLRRHDLIPDLVKAMQIAQNKILSRLTAGTASESLTIELLTVNEEMLAAIRYYEGLCAGTMQRKKPAPAPTPATPIRDDPKKEDSKAAARGESKGSPPSAASAYLAAAGGNQSFLEAPAGAAGAAGQASPVPKKLVPVLAPPSSNTKTKGRHSGSPVAITASAAPPNSGLPIINLHAQSTPPKAVAPAPAPVRKAGDIDLSDLFFGGSAPAPTPAPVPTPAPAPVQVQSLPVPPAPVQTANGARAASILDQFLGVQNNRPTPNPNPFAFASPPQPVATAAPAPAPAPHVINSTALDDDPFAAFAARDAAPAPSAAPAPAGVNSTFEENPFDQLANRGL